MVGTVPGIVALASSHDLPALLTCLGNVCCTFCFEVLCHGTLCPEALCPEPLCHEVLHHEAFRSSSVTADPAAVNSGAAE